MTKGGLYCFGKMGGKFVGVEAIAAPAPGEIAALQIVPAEFALSAGQSQEFNVWGIDANGLRVKSLEDLTWEKFIPPTAKVKAEVDAVFDGNTLVAGKDARLSAGAFKVTWNKLSATTRGRIEAGIGYARASVPAKGKGPAKPIEITLAGVGTVKGVVTDGAGAPLPGRSSPWRPTGPPPRTGQAASASRGSCSTS